MAYKTITRKRDLNRMIADIGSAKIVAFDTETTGLDWQGLDIVVGVAFAIPGQSWYVALDTPMTTIDEPGLFDSSDREQLEIKLSDLNELLSTERVWVAHNAKFDLHMLGPEHPTGGSVACTMLMATILDPDRLKDKSTGGLSLRGLAEFFLSKESENEKKMQAYMEKTKKQHYQVPLDYLAAHACEDVEYTFELFRMLLPMIKKRKMEDIYRLEMDLIPVVVEMEETGVPVDLEYLKSTKEKLALSMEGLVRKTEQYEVNIASPKKLLEFFHENEHKELKSTDEETLAGVDHPLARLTLQYRKLQNLSARYIDNLIKHHNNSRVAMDFRQLGTRTGRSSVAKPALHQIPKRDKAMNAVIRQGFVNASSETQMLYLDFKQIEMIIFAELSKDDRLQAAVIAGEDLHTITAATLFNVSKEDVSEEQRRLGKTMNFAILFGQGLDETAVKLQMSKGKAKAFREQYFSTFPTIKAVQQEIMSKIRRSGYAMTLYGRKRPIASDKAYIGFNTVIQGTAADIMKIGMLRVAKYLKDKKSKLLLTIHDEFMIEHYLDEPIIRPVVALMTRGLILKLPLRVKVEATVTNWAEAEELTDEVLLERISKKMELKRPDWGNIDCGEIEIETPWFDQNLFLVPERTGQKRLELVV